MFSFKQVYFEKSLLRVAGFFAMVFPFCSLYIQIYPLNTCRQDLEENPLDF